MAASRKSATWSARTGRACPRRQAAANTTGMTATAYIGHLIAARQRRPRSAAAAALPSPPPEPPSPSSEAKRDADGGAGLA